MPTAEKERQVQELEERFKRAQALVLTDFRGLSANEMVELRRELRGAHLEYRVVKNRLAKLAAQRAGLELDELLAGPTGICFGYDDPALAFKLSVAVAKKYEHYVIKGGVSEGELVDARGVEELAKLPSREELLTRLAAAFQGPIWSLAAVLSALVRELVVVLSEVAKVKPETASAPAAQKPPEEESAQEAERHGETQSSESEEGQEPNEKGESEAK